MDKLDIHNTPRELERSFKRLEETSMSKSQKDKILRLIDELQLGKSSKTKVGNHRIISYIQTWIRLHEYFQKDFDKVTEKQGEQFYKDLDQDVIKRKNAKPYTPSSKNEFIKAFKRYMGRYLKRQKYLKVCGWIKDYKDRPEVPSISQKDAEKVVEAIRSPRDKALFMFLFDSGARIEEALNIKIKQIEKHQRERSEGEFYLADIKVSKTLPRRISIPIASPFITELLKEHPKKNDPEAYLFEIGYDASRKMIKLYSKKVLGFKITPHSLRHSSASLYCKKIDNPYKFCYRYGWRFGSKEANRYIDRNLLGEGEQEKLVNIIEQDKVEKLERDMKEMKRLLSKSLKMNDLQIEQFGELKKVVSQK